jgi:cardiolipin synthase
MKTIGSYLVCFSRVLNLTNLKEIRMQSDTPRSEPGKLAVTYLALIALCVLLVGCTVSTSSNTITIGPAPNGSNANGSNGPVGSGVQGVKIYVEPNDGESVITDAIDGAQKSVWLEMYLLTDRKVMSSLEEAAHRGLDVRVMLEPHPVGGGGSPSRTLDELRAAGAKAQYTDPDFTLTHEKGMVIDGSTAYIMTSNFTRSALGGTSGGRGSNTNREYGVIDTNQQDVQAVMAIFNADWNHTNAQFNDPNLIVSPINSRAAFMKLISSAHHTLLIEAEELNDNSIEQAIAIAAHNGVHVQVIVPYASSTSTDTNSAGESVLKDGGAQVARDPRLYMHAKIIVVDGKIAFVGSENISTQSLDSNRELGIIVSDSTVLQTLQQTFQQDWSDSRQV